MKIVFFGTPDFAVPSLHALLKSPHDILCVVTQPDRQSGRGRRLTASPVKREALGVQMPLLQPERVRDPEFIRELQSLRPDMIVLVAYGRILPKEIIHLPPLGCINVHASLLPRYRGAAPISRAIMNGDSVTGISIMQMDEGMDTGPVFTQEEIAIDPDDTTGTLSERLAEKGAACLVWTIEEIRAGNLTAQPQSGAVSYAPEMKKSDGLIQWSKSSDEIINFIRAMTPWPGAYSFLQGERIRIIRAAPAEGRDGPGMIVRLSKHDMIVGTGTGCIAVLQLQPTGKPAMKTEEFLQGRHLREGVHFTDIP